MTPGRRPIRGYDSWVRNRPVAGDGDDGDLGKTEKISPKHAVDFLIEATREPNGPKHILVIGAETNIGMALVKDPSLADRLAGITLMGYNFQTGRDPYNIGWDRDAARHVLVSGIPLKVLPIEIGVACQMKDPEYRSLQESKCKHLETIKISMRNWVNFVRRRPGAPIPDYLPRPYDSLAAMTLTHPHLFEWKRGTIRLEPGQSLSTFEQDPNGLHQYVASVDREKVMALHQERLTSCVSTRHECSN
jgi:inosine-uridine nucleoside N-ribohydrolase